MGKQNDVVFGNFCGAIVYAKFVRIINEDIGYIRFDNVGDDRSRCELLIESI